MFARFAVAWCVIFAVVAYDSFLTVRHIEVMPESELNPIGSAIIASDGGVPLLVALKTVGLAAAMLFTFMLWQVEKLRRAVLYSCYSVAVFQLGLLTYLETDIVAMQWHSEWAAFERSRVAPSPESTATARAAVPAGPVAYPSSATPVVQSAGSWPWPLIDPVVAIHAWRWGVPS